MNDTTSGWLGERCLTTQIIIMTQPPYAFDFLIPVYADLQVNFSRKRSPFFAEFKLRAAIGKRFALNGDIEINVTIGWDGIIWPWYINAPLSIGVRYGF